MDYIPDDLSVVVLTYNKPDALIKLLKSIPSRIEIVVADDGTLPGLRSRLPEQVKLYTHEHDGNRASTCRNEGAKLCTRDNILFLDDDVTPHGLCYAAHSMALKMHEISYGLLPREQWIVYTDDRMLFYSRDDQSLWNFGWSGNMAIRKDVFFSIGGFDADTFNGSDDEPAHGFEDLDLARRCFMSHRRMCLNKLALAHHPSAHTSENPSEAVLRNQRRYQEKWDEVVA